MNKKIILGLSILIVMSLGILLYFYVDKTTGYNKYINLNPDKNNNNFLTLMLEQDDGTYKETTSSDWPGEEYVFNNELSSCQNGGELSWDSENKIVKMSGVSADKCQVYFDKYILPQINKVSTIVSNDSIIVSVDATQGTNSIYRYYYSINDGAYIGSASNTYTFTGLESGTTYNIKVYVEDTEGYSSDTSSLDVETDNPVLLADYIKNTVYQGDGVNGLYFHDGQGSYTNANQEAGDNSYRYAGANPNNYVCFGSDVAICPEDNLYRIIGVFEDNVKLIKSDYANSDLLGTSGGYSNDTYNANNYSSYKGYHSIINRYYWNQSSGGNWSNSLLNTLNLNTTYLNNIGLIWSEKITTHTWYISGYTTYNATAKVLYTAESSGSILNAKVGLIYLSDYGYAAYPESWSETFYRYDNDNIRNNNWMYMGMLEWTISMRSNIYGSAFYIDFVGNIINNNVTTGFAVRPCFYLNSDVAYSSGSGTLSNPYRIA